jgi:predicted helicase
MSEGQKPPLAYLQTISKELAAGNATEHTHRTALKILVESIGDKITATNEPQRIQCGAPDFIITKGAVTIGYVECKDVDKSLDDTEKTDQLKRYLSSLSNFMLTDYLEFRWYVDGQVRMKSRMGTTSGTKIKHTSEDIQQTVDLLSAFLAKKAEGVGTAKDLALKMAQLAHLMRELIINTFNTELEKGSLHAQMAAFKQNLIPDLSPEQFADMYAQTIAYGLFAARCNTDNAQYFTRQNSIYLLPKTNPFLFKIFNDIAGANIDDNIAWCVDELVQVLAQANMPEILTDFGKQMGREDPVVHFYETFLKAYDPKVREMRGVYYTPEPVVSYIVRSIDHILKTRFDKPQGLADPNTLILDPAVGTATFLYKVIDEIHHSFVATGQQGVWNNYVAEKLLPRLFGFELLMAPYAIAHFKLALQLKDSGYKFDKDQRLGIYLTNTLEEGFKKAEQLAGFNEYIVEEANAAAEIKKEKKIMVVVGNPPYSVSSANKSEYIEKLMESYKAAVRNERNIQPLSDDYIKFIRFAHDRIERTGHGIVGMITNNGYLNGLIHRGMREELFKTFDEIYVLNLHGNAMMGETAPNGSADKNVFDIRQGVAILMLVKSLKHNSKGNVHYSELWGVRAEKYNYLSNSDLNLTEWKILTPTSPNYFFVSTTDDFKEEYAKGWKITDIYSLYSSGIKTHRDHFVIDFDDSVLKDRITIFKENQVSDNEIREKYDLEETISWKISEARKIVRNERNWKKLFVRCLYRPFDFRSIFYHDSLIERSRFEVMQHMLTNKNLALISMRQVAQNEPYSHFGVSQDVVDNRMFYSNRGIQCLFPLYLYPSDQEVKSGLYKAEDRRPNLNLEFIKALSEKLNLIFVEDRKGDLTGTFGPEDIFNYAYSVFHSPTYRTRYAEFLKIDFPRLPLTSNKTLFKSLADKGAELVALHLMEAQVLNNRITKYPISGSNLVEKVEYKEAGQRVFINKDQYFEGVPPEVWNFRVGGYQVCEKWLKDRKGRNLSYDDITHYQKIVVALKETIRLMAEIDIIIPVWPME